MLVDDLIPVYDFNEIHSIEIRARSEAIFQAIREVTPAEITLLRTLLGIHSLSGHFIGEDGAAFADGQSFLEQMLNGGFVLLAEAPDREMVLGHAGQFWRLWGGSSPQIATSQESNVRAS